MEVGLVHSLSPVSAEELFGTTAKPILPVPAKLALPMEVNNYESLNSVCMQMNASCTSASGFKQTESNSAQPVKLSKLASEKILKVLEAIPIYEEVKIFKVSDSPVSSKRDHSAYHAFTQSNSYNMVCGRKRVTSGSCEADMGAAVYSGANSTAQSYSLNNSQADNSHPIGEFKVAIGGESTGKNAMALSGVYQNLPTQTVGFEGAYAENQMYAAYNQDFVAEGANTVLPPGYIQVKKEKTCSRKTKVVTNCEHTDRKHYAKGLCSTCYHKNGRTKKAWNCEHKNKLHYAKGCCQECYIIFHSKRGLNRLKRMVNDNSNSLTELMGEDEYSPYADEF